MSLLIKKALPHLAALAIFLGISTAFFYPQLNGKVLQQSDMIQYMGMSQEVRNFYEETGERSLWTNAMFGGMPTYQINTVKQGNQLKILSKLFFFFIKAPIGLFFNAMLGFYILMLCLRANQWLSIIGAVAFGLTTNNLILFETGHLSKITVISFLPLVIAGLILTYRKNYLWGALLFAAGLGLNLMANHVQMTYYFGLTLVVFVIAQFIYDLREKQLPQFFRASAVLLLAGLVALGSAASNLWVTYEYSKDTMRGKPILENTEEATARVASSSNVEGLAWDYAMAWSNGWIDLAASFIPGVAGGGSQEPIGDDAAILRDLRQKGYQAPKNFRAPLYWGDLPFTSGPIYFGAAAVFLFLMGLSLQQGPLKWWLGIATLLTLLLSMGENLEAFNRFFFDYFPLYNKFRTPNSILSVTAVFIPLLGFWGMDRLLKTEVSKVEARRSLYIAGGIISGLCLFFLLLGPSAFSFSAPGDANLQAQGLDLQALIADRKALLKSDSLRSLVLVLLSAGLLWIYQENIIKKQWLLLGIAAVIVFDAWSVGRRYLSPGDFVEQNVARSSLQPRPADTQILQDEDPDFRVFDLTIPTFESSKASYFHKAIGGYHAAKLQRYQDIIDRHLLRGNQKVIDMLNAKYFIVGGQNNQAEVQRNPGALGNAWFVKTVIPVTSANAEIDSLNTFDPAGEAIVHQEFSGYIGGLAPDGSGSIRLSDYRPNRLTYESESDSEQLAVFSEIWYGPDKGWQAYIDGQKADHIRANYVLRAMKVPAGRHKIEFVFDPQAYRAGIWISGIFSGLIVLSLLGAVSYYAYGTYKKLPEEKAQHSSATAAAKAKPQAKARPAGQKRRPGSNSPRRKK